jgi:DnaJ-class molecular chaperone
VFGRRRRAEIRRAELMWRGSVIDNGPTQEEIYYNSAQHFHEMPYRIGDRLPRNFWIRTSTKSPYLGNRAWPSWDRDTKVRGEAACSYCNGRGLVLYAHTIVPEHSDVSPDDHKDVSLEPYGVLAEKECDSCDGTGDRHAKKLRIARGNGFSTYEDYLQAVYERQLESRRQDEEAYRELNRRQCNKCGGGGVIVKTNMNPYGPANVSNCWRCGGRGYLAR